MAKYQYKTKDGQDYVIPGVGATKGGVIDTDTPIENANFVLVAQQPQAAPAPAAPAAPAPQPAPQPQAAAQPAAPAPAVTQTPTAKETN